jgi:hypothetical protein
MQYFDTLPKIIQTDSNRTSIILTNLMARVSIVPEFLKNPVIYYDYDIQEGDTPETIAYKYYGDSYRYWIVLFTNQIVDPQWDWPIESTSFNKYIEDKYQTFNPYSTIKYYEKIVTKYDSSTQTTSVEKIVIDEDTYNTLTDSTNTYVTATNSVTITITKRAVTYYDYEVDLNDAKRTIKILNSIYVDEVEKQFKSLLS